MVGRPKPWTYVYLLTKDSNCCESGFYSLNYYRPGFDEDGKVHYYSENEIIVKEGVELISENLPPFRFELKTNVALRSIPDPSASEMKKYIINNTGFAVASKKGSDSKTWWLVLMPEGDEHRFRAGWMPSEDLKRKF